MRDGKSFVGINRLFDAMTNNGGEFTLSWCTVKEGTLDNCSFCDNRAFLNDRCG